jgi:hypothetical protein
VAGLEGGGGMSGLGRFHLTTTPTAAGVIVHGGGRRGERGYRIVPVELAEWTAANRRARRAYEQAPNACTREIWKAGYR